LRIIGFFLLLLLAPALARAVEPVATVPLSIDYGGWYTVPVKVNGEGPYDFIIDTGATQTLVFSNLHVALAFPPTGGPPQTVLGLASIGKFPTYRIARLEVGPARLDEVVTVILNKWEVGGRSPYGVLGLDFLARYFIIFDRERLELRLYESREQLEIAAKGWKATDFRRRPYNLAWGALYTVEGYANSRLMRFIVDLGATGTIINRQALGRIARAGEAGVAFNPRASQTGTRIVDALDETNRARPARIKRFRVGRTSWYDKIFFAYDAPIFEELGVQGEAYGLLGADLFHDRSFAMDFKGEQLFIGPRLRSASGSNP